MAYDIITVPGIHAYDGYCGEPFFKLKENTSVYDDPETDNQMLLQLRPIEEIRQKIRSKIQE